MESLFERMGVTYHWEGDVRIPDLVLSDTTDYYRKKAGYTQEVFTEKIDRSLNFLAQVEGYSTTRGISLETLFKICDVLDIQPGKLLDDDD